jgi:hypothetical protein
MFSRRSRDNNFLYKYKVSCKTVGEEEEKNNNNRIEKSCVCGPTGYCLICTQEQWEHLQPIRGSNLYNNARYSEILRPGPKFVQIVRRRRQDDV